MAARRSTEVVDDDKNLSMKERIISAVVGLGLAAAAAKPRPNPILNVIALAAGSFLAWRGATGRGPIKALVKPALAGADSTAARRRPVRR